MIRGGEPSHIALTRKRHGSICSHHNGNEAVDRHVNGGPVGGVSPALGTIGVEAGARVGPTPCTDHGLEVPGLCWLGDDGVLVANASGRRLWKRIGIRHEIQCCGLGRRERGAEALVFGITCGWRIAAEDDGVLASGQNPGAGLGRVGRVGRVGMMVEVDDVFCPRHVAAVGVGVIVAAIIVPVSPEGVRRGYLVTGDKSARSIRDGGIWCHRKSEHGRLRKGERHPAGGVRPAFATSRGDAFVFPAPSACRALQ